MNKKAYLEETYNSAFKDELEKISLLHPLKASNKILMYGDQIGKKRVKEFLRAIKNAKRRTQYKISKEPFHENLSPKALDKAIEKLTPSWYKLRDRETAIQNIKAGLKLM